MSNYISFFRIIVAGYLCVCPASILASDSAHYFFIGFCGISDFLDGYLARKYKLTSKKGAVLDQIADKVFFTTVMIILCNAQMFPVLLTALFVIRDIAILGIRIINFDVTSTKTITILGKTKTFLLYILLLVLPIYHDRLFPIFTLALIIGYSSLFMAITKLNKNGII